MNLAVITARGGSKSIPHKNLYKINGVPMVVYAIRAAKNAEKIDRTFVSTDSLNIADVSRRAGAEVVDRPPELSKDDTNHGLVIQHAVNHIRASDEDMQDALENVVVLLGNTVMVDSALIDEALTMLDNHKSIDSVMSVWEAQDDHPYRALELTDAGTLKVFGDSSVVHTNRQTYPKVYFYDQGVWTFRWECVNHQGSIRPWWWMGNVCMPIIRPWIAGRDVHSQLDIDIAEWWVGRTK